MSNKSKKGFNNHPAAKIRRESAFNRLEIQLKSGLKPFNEYSGNDPVPKVREYPLEEKDITRIKKELVILKSRI